MTRINITPHLMFQFAATINAWTSNDAPGEKWELDDSFRMPNFAKLQNDRSSPTPVELSLAWSLAGIYLQLSLPNDAIRQALNQANRSTIRFFVDTRGAIGNKRLTKFCHQIQYELQSGTKSIRTTLIQGKLDLNASSEPTNDSASVQSLTKVTKDRWQLNSFLPARLLSGYQPREFSQISYFYDLQSGLQSLINAGTDPKVRYDQDPSVWIRGQLKGV